MSPTPVSDRVLADLRAIVVDKGPTLWLDRHGCYSPLVDRLRISPTTARPAFPFPLFAWRGSFLRLMLDLDAGREATAYGGERLPLVVHLPGFIPEDVPPTPLYPLHLSGHVQRMGFDSAVQKAAVGYASPEEVAAWLAAHPYDLEAADAWLAGRMAGGGELAHTLRATSLPAQLDELLRKGEFSDQAASEGVRGALLLHWANEAGLSEAMRAPFGPLRPPWGESLAAVLAAWCLLVEYVADLHRDAPLHSELLKPLRTLPTPLVARCEEVAVHLRRQHGPWYRALAHDLERHAALAPELAHADATILGSIDTFRFEATAMLEGAIGALDDEAWDQVRGWATKRLAATESPWLDEALRARWELLRHAALLGAAITAAGQRLDRHAGWDLVLSCYKDRGAAVDSAHRALVMGLARHSALLAADPRLQRALTTVVQCWEAWAGQWAEDTVEVGRRQGFLPPPDLRQRGLFTEVVLPLCRKPGPTVLFMVDALRYELAVGLAAELDGESGAVARLDARLAELPTITSVGMNALAPVAPSGRLTVVGGKRLEGLRNGAYVVKDRDTRVRAMHEALGVRASARADLDDVLRSTTESLRGQLYSGPLMVVRSLEIDEAGEVSAALLAEEQTLARLAAAWRKLREAGARRAVFTADHGFLLLDPTSRRQRHGRRIDPTRRYVIRADRGAGSAEVSVPFASLGYETPGEGELFAVFPTGIRCFDTGGGGSDFVHGGPTLQERVIPVLVVEQRRARGGSARRWGLTAQRKATLSGLHLLEIQVIPLEQVGLSFGAMPEIELCFEVVDGNGERVLVEHLEEPGRPTPGGFFCPPGKTVVVGFRVRGDRAGKVAVRLHHPAAAHDVDDLVLEERFVVSLDATSAAPAPVTAPANWAEAIEDPAARRLLVHLDTHGALTEDEAAAILDNPRQARRLLARIDSLVALAPFDVRRESAAGRTTFTKVGT